MGQISGQVSEYIEKNPIIKHCIGQGIINYSALARQIQKELNIKKNFEAVLIAIRRKADQLIKSKKSIELAISPILKESSLDIKTKIWVLNLDVDCIKKLNELTNALYLEKAHFQIIQGVNHITLVIEEKYVKKAEEALGYYVIKKEENLVEIIVKSPPKIEKTPGVVAAILLEISESGINVVETMSTYTDTIMIIEEKDLTKTITVLDKLLK